MAEIYWHHWDNFRSVCYLGSTCYQIFGVTEVIKNSEALQELPEKSFEAINRLLDSIASEDKEEGN